MKTIVTHFTPDVDAIASVWLLKRFLPGWKNAQVKFVPAGETLGDEPVDNREDILHVDTGFGKLDHHQTAEDTCAAKRTLQFVSDQLSVVSGKGSPKKKQNFPDETLVRLIDIVNDIDHFNEVYYPNPMADFYDFGLTSQLDGWKLIYSDQHEKLLNLGLVAFDGIYKKFQDKVWAEHEIDKKGVEFKTVWGKGIGVETINDEVIRLAQRMGYLLVVRKDPKKDYVRIKAQPESSVDLENVYNKLRKLDKQATWFLHVGKKMVLNGSMKNPKTKATKLELGEIIEILKQVKS